MSPQPDCSGGGETSQSASETQGVFACLHACTSVVRAACSRHVWCESPVACRGRCLETKPSQRRVCSKDSISSSDQRLELKITGRKTGFEKKTRHGSLTCSKPPLRSVSKSVACCSEAEQVRLTKELKNVRYRKCQC